MKTGVPQGSLLGPLLFLIYINNLNQIFNEKEINVFADDTVIIITGDNLEEMIQTANRKLTVLNEYLEANGIKINNEKTQYLLLFPKGKKQKTAYPIYIQNEIIHETDVKKVLGIEIDNKLNFNIPKSISTIHALDRSAKRCIIFNIFSY